MARAGKLKQSLEDLPKFRRYLVRLRGALSCVTLRTVVLVDQSAQPVAASDRTEAVGYENSVSRRFHIR